jgi:ribosomal protein L34
VREHSGHPRAAWVIISPSAQRRVGSRAAGKECRPTLSMTGEDGPQRGVQAARNNEASVRGPSEDEAGGFRSRLGTHQGRPRWILEDRRKESRPGTQRPGQANQLTWRGTGSERLRMPRTSCCTPSRSRERGPVDLDRMVRPARLRGSWCSSMVSTRAHWDAKSMTAAGRNTRRTCTEGRGPRQGEGGG